jgi:hypothetical protein
MSKIIELLEKAASLEKKAYYDYVKSFSSSSIASLVKSGVSFDKASSLVKEACESNPRVKALSTSVLTFEKMAEYIKETETKLDELEKIAEKVEIEEKIESSEPLNKLAKIGFTQEEIEKISELPENLISKVASVGSKPWELGSGVGIPREKTDPLLEFLLN